jgi:hypothetical protein
MTPLHPRLRLRLCCLIMFVCFKCQAQVVPLVNAPAARPVARARSSDSERCHLGSASKMADPQLLIQRSEGC